MRGPHVANKKTIRDTPGSISLATSRRATTDGGSHPTISRHIPDPFFCGSSQRSVQLGRYSWLRRQVLSVTYMAKEHRLYLERSCRPPESPARAAGGIARGLPVPRGLNSQRGFSPAVELRRKSRPRSTSLLGPSLCKFQRLSTLRCGRLPPQAPTKERGPRRRPSPERQTTSPLSTGHEHIRSLFPRRGRPAGG